MTHPLTGETVDLTDRARMTSINDAAGLFAQAQAARDTAVLLDDFGCVGSAADCRVLAQDLDKRAIQVLADDREKADQ